MSHTHHAGRGLEEALRLRFGRGVERAWSDGEFNAWALRVFAHQFERNGVYRAFAERRGALPDTVEHWTRIPAVPTRAFKHVTLVAGDAAAAERVFLTSGTSEGVGSRGAHHVLSLELYRAAALPNLRAHLIPGRGRVRILSLVPSAAAAPESSLATMIDFAIDAFGAAGSASFGHPARGLDRDGLTEALRIAEQEGQPVLLMGTAFAFVHWLQQAADVGMRVVLPEGSRVMETGGFKGRSRAVPRHELYAEIEVRLGVPGRRIVNEYGMTELLSQFYESTRVHEPSGGRPLIGPPWVRTRVLDPETLADAQPGDPGLLCHLDLANLGSVEAVLTEDLGVALEDGFRLLGRRPGSEPRGCSLALEELLEGRGP